MNKKEGQKRKNKKRNKKIRQKRKTKKKDKNSHNTTKKRKHINIIINHKYISPQV